MKCEAVSIRASGGRVEVSVAREPGERVEREDLRRSVAVAPSSLEDGRQVVAVAIERGEERVPEHLLLATAGGSVECRGRFERRPGLGAAVECAQDPAEVDAAERGEAGRPRWPRPWRSRVPASPAPDS
jgi:hypothetical protein